MQDFRDEVPAAVRRYIVFVNAMGPIVILAIPWGLYAVMAVFDIDITQVLRRRQRDMLRPEDAERIFLWTAIFVTIASLSYGWWSIRRALHLAENGIPVACEVVNVGSIVAHGLVRVDYEYEVDGTNYRHSLSCLLETAHDYECGNQLLEVVYDPDNPRRVMLKSDVFPKSKLTLD